MQKCALALAGVLLIVSAASGGNPFEGVQLGEYLYGPTIDAESADGKIILVIYWGINCPNCKAVMPWLVSSQKELEPSGKFTMFATHVQQTTDAVKKYLKQIDASFPCYDRTSVNPAPGRISLPYGQLFDSKGKLVASSHPGNLVKKAKKLMKRTPHPLLRGVTVKLCAREVQAVTGSAMWGGAVRSLRQKAERKGPVAEEALSLLANVEPRIRRELDKGKTMLETRPSVGVPFLHRFALNMRGLKEADEARKLIAPFPRDRGYQTLLKVAEVIEKLNVDDQLEEPRNARTVAAMKKALNRIIDAGKSPPGVLFETEAVLAELP